MNIWVFTLIVVIVVLTAFFSYTAGYGRGRDRETWSKTHLRNLEYHYPRVMKVMRRMQPMLIISWKEPYYSSVYGLIRHFESAKGTWTKDDEREYLDQLAHAKDPKDVQVAWTLVSGGGGK